MKEKIISACFSAIGGAIAYVQPAFPYMLVCLIAVAVDCFTAWSLSRRAAKKFPGRADGKFKSVHAVKVFVSLIKVSALIVLMHLIDTIVFPSVDLHLANIVAGMFCFAQVWSILENESSLNDAAWAKAMQRVMVDKTARHLGFRIDEYLGKKDDGDGTSGDGADKDVG